MTADLYRAAQLATDWLDQENGRSELEKTLRLLKVTEEAGEVAAAWIGYTGQNPRKGHTHTVDDVVKELADVVMTALVAMRTLDADPERVLDECAAKILGRMSTEGPA